MPTKPKRGMRTAKNKAAKSKSTKVAMPGGKGKKKSSKKVAGAGAGFGSKGNSKRA